MWWAAKRFGYSDKEWDQLKSWLNATLIKLVNGEEFQSGVDARKYLLFSSEGEVASVEDSSWEHLMSVMDTISK